MFETIPENQTAPNSKRHFSEKPSHSAGVSQLDVMVRPSRYLQYFYLIMYGLLLALTAGLMLLGGYLAWLAFVVSAILVAQFIARWRWLATQHWHLLCDSDGWWLGRPDGELLPARVVGNTRLWRAAIFLTLVDSRGKHPLVLLADSAAPDDWRRLRVWLVTAPSVC